MSIETPQNADVWRVAALTAMSPEKLRAMLAGNASEAAPWIISAARCGLVEAQLRLGRMLLAGEGVARDERAAFNWFDRAARKQDPEAQNMVGRCYEHGWGTAIDPARAAEWYERAASAGHAWAQYNLGHLLLDGNGVARDTPAAFQLYLSAANQGHVRAMNLVGRCCEEGWGTQKDPAAARVWYRRSAEGGYFRGAYNFASYLVAERCLEDAAFWFASALSKAPQPTRDTMRGALLRQSHPRLRALASGSRE